MDSLELLAKYGYALVFGTVFGEQIGLPLPAGPFLMAAGALSGVGRLHPAVLLGVSTFASFAADLVWYWLGRLRGARVLGWLCRLSLEPDSCVRKTEGTFARHGARALVIGKFIPGFSTLAPPLAAMSGIPFLTFAAYTGLGGLVWSATYLAIGWVFSAQLETAMEYVDALGGWALVLVGAALAGYVVFKYIGRQRFLRRIRIARITPEELKAKLDDGEAVMVVDVRDRIDFDAEPSIIPGALHLSIEELDARHHEIPRERDIVLYCT